MGCGNSSSTAADTGARDGLPAVNPQNPLAIFNTTMGTFKAELYLDKMPLTASNFIDLSQTSFYDGLHFHRVIPNFMNQFGCPYSRDPKSLQCGTGNPPDGKYRHPHSGEVYQRFGGGNIRDEFTAQITNAPGTLSMANTGQKDSGGSQFFLNVALNSNLDHFSPGQSRHPVFGRVVESYNVVVAISQVQTAAGDNPVQPIKMNSISIENLEPDEDCDDCADDVAMDAGFAAGAIAGSAAADDGDGDGDGD